MGEGSCGLGKNQRGFRVGCCEMVGDYSEDSSVEENLNLLLRLTRIEANVDLKDKGKGFLEGRLQEQRMLGASAATPSNDRLLGGFGGKGFTRERALKSSTKTQRDPETRENQVDSS